MASEGGEPGINFIDPFSPIVNIKRSASLFKSCAIALSQKHALSLISNIFQTHKPCTYQRKLIGEQFQKEAL
jgi:hypothetical protein